MSNLPVSKLGILSLVLSIPCYLLVDSLGLWIGGLGVLLNAVFVVECLRSGKKPDS